MVTKLYKLFYHKNTVVRDFFNVETDVDMLVSLVEQKGTISIEQAAKQLKVPMQILQRWIDFLVEEDVLGIEYKFVTPYLYFNKPLKKYGEEEVESKVEEKKDFFAKRQSENMPDDKIHNLWQGYLNQNLALFRKEFIKKAELKGITGTKSQELWQKYYAYLKGDSV